MVGASRNPMSLTGLSIFPQATTWSAAATTRGWLGLIWTWPPSRTKCSGESAKSNVDFLLLSSLFFSPSLSPYSLPLPPLFLACFSIALARQVEGKVLLTSVTFGFCRSVGTTGRPWEVWPTTGATPSSPRPRMMGASSSATAWCTSE